MSSDHTETPDWETQLLRHAGNIPEIAVSLCEAFLHEVPMLLLTVNQLTQSQQTAGLHRSLHTLNSCLSYVADADELSLAADLERQSNHVDFVLSDAWQTDFRKLERIASKWVTEVSEFRQRLAEKPPTR